VIRAFLLLAGLALAALTFLQPSENPTPAPPVCPGPGPCPAPQPKPAPRPSPRPWGDLLPASVEASVGGRVAPDGAQLMIDLPGDRHVKNCGGSDGLGLCVFTSIGMAADWANVPQLVDFQGFMKRRPGGGYPSKVDAMIKAICAEKGQPVPEYLNVEAADIDLIDAALAAGHVVCCTYSRSPTRRYKGATIAHMVCIVHGDPKGNNGAGCYAILDNNYIGESNYEYLSRAELASVRPRWCVILISQPGPPPPPAPLS